jgi:hypothetical protein
MKAGRFRQSKPMRYNARMTKVIENQESFEVQSDEGVTLKSFRFDNDPTRRAVSGVVNRKRALLEARTYAGKGHTFVERKRGGDRCATVAGINPRQDGDK